MKSKDFSVKPVEASSVATYLFNLSVEVLLGVIHFVVDDILISCLISPLMEVDA